ncbi:MAG: hypothetical protein NZX77_00955 [Polyangiaceae bacterium]|nr:hypothetical protein [Polyangiaceae bacterium]
MAPLLRSALSWTLMTLVSGCMVSSAPPRGMTQQGTYSQSAPAGSPEAVVQAAVHAALRNDFQAYLALVHSQEKINAKQISQIEHFSWKRFVNQARWYLDNGGNIYVERRHQEGQDLILYVRDFSNAGRMPPPMRLRPDQGQWRIASNSL